MNSEYLIIDCSRCKDGYILMVGKFLGSSDIR